MILPAAFYQSPSGKEPVKDWLLALEEKSRRVVGRDIATVEFGWPLGMPLCRKLGGGAPRGSFKHHRQAHRAGDLRRPRRSNGLAEWLRQEGAEDPETRLGTRETTSKGDHIMTKKKGHVGSSFQDYLAEEGTLEETNAIAVKRVLAWQLEQAMARRRMSRSAMAQMSTSRSQLDRILDPDNDHIRLDTLTAAAHVFGLSLRIEFVG